MIDRIEFKKQGGDVDSWIIYYLDGRIPEIVYTDPSIEQAVDISNIDIDTLSNKELKKLANRLKPELGL